MIVCNTDNETDKEAAYIDALVSKQVDGVILISSGSDPETLNPLISHDVPFVIADREFSADVADVVSLDNEQAGFDVTNYLLNLGHRKIGCITGPNNFSPSIQRLNGFIRAHKEWGSLTIQNSSPVGSLPFRAVSLPSTGSGRTTANQARSSSSPI